MPLPQNSLPPCLRGRIKEKFDVNTLSVHPRVNMGRGKVLAWWKSDKTAPSELQKGLQAHFPDEW